MTLRPGAGVWLRTVAIASITVGLAACVTHSGRQALALVGFAPFADVAQIRRVTALLFIPLAVVPDAVAPPESPVWWGLVLAFALVLAWTLVRAWDTRLRPVWTRLPGGGWGLLAVVLGANITLRPTLAPTSSVAVAELLPLVLEAYALVLVPAMLRLLALAAAPWNAVTRPLRRRGLIALGVDLGLGGRDGDDGRFGTLLRRYAGVWLILMLITIEAQALAIQAPARPWKLDWAEGWGFGHGFWSFWAGGRLYGDGVHADGAPDMHWMNVRLGGAMGGRPAWQSAGDQNGAGLDVAIAPSGRFAAFRDPASRAILLFRPATCSVDTLTYDPRVPMWTIGWSEGERAIEWSDSLLTLKESRPLGDGGPAIPLRPAGTPPPVDPEALLGTVRP